jgi:hypothetical protein
MIHLLLVAALVLFVLWIVGLAGAWAASTAWTLFVIACALIIVWALISMVGGRRTTVP